jgi:flagellar motor protein MotB
VASLPGVDSVTVEMTIDRRVTGRSLSLRIEPAFPPPLAAGASDERYQGLAELSRAALDALPGVSLALTGHTDDVGSESTNQSLSVALARLAVDRLAERGVPAERTIVRGAGESQPIADNATPEGRQANRRIEAAFEGIRPG